MKCFYCKSELEVSTTTHVAELENCIVIIKNVPCMKCEQCGEVVYSGAVAKRLDEILDSFEKAMTEIAIVNYTGSVA